jgi:hypothetical protein
LESLAHVLLVTVWLPLVRSVVTNNELFHEGLLMRALLSILVLFSASLPAFGVEPPTNGVPEPESLSLLGVAAVAMLVALRRKK